MALFESNCDEIIDVFKNNLNINNTVKSISHTFLNLRFAESINYKPYYQRNYVWDDDKATYFIESILLGTEIPPIVIFDNGNKKEVIDGRQRYETIQRFLEGKLTLTAKGLKSLTNLSDKKYIQLTEDISSAFKNTKIRILQFSVVNEPSLTDIQKDKIKKEIFRRYNSGITSLKPPEIDRAEFIHDKTANGFKELLNKENPTLNDSTLLFVPLMKRKLQKRDKVNYLLTRIRILITLPFIPIYSYAAAKSKSDAIKNFYYVNFNDFDTEQTLLAYKTIVVTLVKLRQELVQLKSPLTDNVLFYEVNYWVFSIILKKYPNMYDKIDIRKLAVNITCANKDSTLFDNIDSDKSDLNAIFAQTGSHYYKSVVNRYLLLSNYFSSAHNFEFPEFFRNSIEYKAVMENNIASKQFADFKLSKTDPASSSIYDILTYIKESKFLIRPEYQRSEVISKQKASYLLESILLGIKLPPIFIYKREDGISEVIDGQQRLLSIIGFLGEVYKDEDGEFKLSNINKFKLSKLRILKELNNSDIVRVEEIDPTLKDKILDFPIDIVEINQSNNKLFSPIDLFLRLNTKPYPILPNTYEMWNAYIDKMVIDQIKLISDNYSNSLFKQADKRMKNEELITTLAYLDYRYKTEKTQPSKIINIFIRNKRINARMNAKSNITTLFDSMVKSGDDSFIEAVCNVQIFIQKLAILCGNNFEDFNTLISHKKTNVQSRTNQNFYLLWIALNNISIEKTKEKTGQIFNLISNIFEIVQKAPDNLTAEKFIRDLESVNS